MDYQFTEKEINRAKEYTTIFEVVPGSIAEEIGVVPGDVLVAINGKTIKDVFDYRMRINEEYLELSFFLHDDGLQTVEIERDLDEEIGLGFNPDNQLLDKCMSCHNNCWFCFIAQNPKGLRESLYFKDDDVRMSFLTGNYVTLTNLKDDEFERMLSYRLSPINVSVHTTNPELRCKMLNNRFAGKILDRLKRISELGLEINCQFVLCPHINDGPELERSIQDLYNLGDVIRSIAVVPVGLTQFRDENGLHKLERYNKETAGAVLDIVNKWQKIFLEERGSRLFYAGDEFYIRAERPIPPAVEYEDYPQLENGVGMIADYIEDMDQHLIERETKNLAKVATEGSKTTNVWEVSGIDAYDFVKSFEERISALYGINYSTKCVINKFFGPTITVTGLLVGGDICNEMERLFEEEGKPSLIILSKNMLKSDEDIFLDDMLLEDLKKRLGVEIYVKKETNDLFAFLDKKYLGR